MSEDTTSHGKRAGFDRRHVLKGFAGAAAVASLSGKAFAQTATKELPDLAKAVADGKLPKLADRLSANPLVITVDKIGSYGGVLRRGLSGTSDHNGILRSSEIWVSRAGTWFHGSAAQRRREVGRQRRFHRIRLLLRKGMKWSDGKPFTADDIVFSIEDCVKNSELYKSLPVFAGHRRQARHGHQDRRHHGTVQIRRTVRPVPSAARHAPRPARNAVLQALCEPVPAQVQR